MSGSGQSVQNRNDQSVFMPEEGYSQPEGALVRII